MKVGAGGFERGKLYREDGIKKERKWGPLFFDMRQRKKVSLNIQLSDTFL